ncbi:MAG: HAMP domain-containing protein [Candidatus Aminicenantes bacterium]|nr:HAMP domain-containing protein [Candidatus Aminicenantes bacterium]
MVKFFKNLSIKNKLVSIVLFVSILAILIGFTIVVYQDIKIFKQDLVNATKMSAQVMVEFCTTGLSFGAEYAKQVEGEIKRFLKAMPIIEAGCVYDEKGEKYAFYKKAGSTFKPDMSAGTADEFTRFEGDFLHIYQPIVSEGRKLGSIFLRSSTSQLDEKINKYILTMVLVTVVLIVLSYFLALRLQRVISRPILRLAGVTGDISLRADYSVRVQKEGSDEIGKLYDGFNIMLEQIQLREKERDEAEAARERLLEELAEKNKELEQVVYVTSHDLRSPLVNIQGFSKELDYSIKDLSLLLNIDEIPDEVKEKISLIIEEDIPDSLEYILTSATKMDSLLNGLLKLSRVGRSAATFQDIDMNVLIKEVQHAFEFQIKEQKAALKIEDLPPCFGNEMQINQVFSNLLNNALKYLDPEKKGFIKISGRKEKNHVIYCVEDNGIGIASEHQKKVFEIFHRLNPEETSGEGLGLTIVNKILSRHNGRIRVNSEPGKGSEFCVKLPAPGGDKTENNEPPV